MENLTLSNILIALLGIVFFSLLRLKAVFIRKEQFSLGYWIKDNILDIIAAMILAGVGIVAQQDFTGFIGLQISNNSEMGTLMRSFLIGTMAYPAVAYFTTWFKDSIKNGGSNG
ncbi:hypothetical protein QQ054_32170 [Oscillatoria amoena NRMC-F 0135]|nr:hypothetical protein [Oscillatoria amoena NRMC-F 0135]